MAAGPRVVLFAHSDPQARPAPGVDSHRVDGRLAQRWWRESCQRPVVLVVTDVQRVVAELSHVELRDWD
eukprot:8851792-Pyramimonas_sp.AAC.1